MDENMINIDSEFISNPIFKHLINYTCIFMDSVGVPENEEACDLWCYN